MNRGTISIGSTTRTAIGLVLKENGFICPASSYSFLVLCLFLMHFYQSLSPQCHPLFPILSLFSSLFLFLIWKDEPDFCFLVKQFLVL